MVSGDIFKCEDCSYDWQTKKQVGEPAFCPDCRSRVIINKSKNRREREKRIGHIGKNKNPKDQYIRKRTKKSDKVLGNILLWIVGIIIASFFVLGILYSYWPYQKISILNNYSKRAVHKILHEKQSK